MTPVAIVFIVFIFLVSLVAIITEHMRKMAEIKRPDSTPNLEVAELRNELRELKEIVHQIAIAVDRSSPILRDKSVDDERERLRLG